MNIGRQIVFNSIKKEDRACLSLAISMSVTKMPIYKRLMAIKTTKHRKLQKENKQIHYFLLNYIISHDYICFIHVQ